MQADTTRAKWSVAAPGRDEIARSGEIDEEVVSDIGGLPPASVFDADRATHSYQRPVASSGTEWNGVEREANLGHHVQAGTCPTDKSSS